MSDISWMINALRKMKCPDDMTTQDPLHIFIDDTNMFPRSMKKMLINRLL